MSINRMYYGTKKIYSFLENGNQGGECNCEQEYQNGYNQGYQDGQNSCGAPVGPPSDCTLGTGSLTLGSADVGVVYELFASDDGYDGWTKFIVDTTDLAAGCPTTQIYNAYEAADKLRNGELNGLEGYVKGYVTEIKRTRPQNSDARYVIDGEFDVYNGQYNVDMGIEVGDWVLVKGTFSLYNGQPQFSAGSIIIEQKRDEECGECSGSNPLMDLGWEDGEAAEIMDYVKSIPNEYERYVNYNSDEDGSAIDLFVKDSGQTDMIFAPFVDLGNQTSVSRMFFEQGKMIGIPWMHTSNVQDFSQSFYGCGSLKKLPVWDFSNGRNFYSAFRECGNLEELVFDSPLADSYNQMCAFANIPRIILDGTSCEYIGEFFGWYGDQMPSVNHLVVKNLKCNWDDDNGFAVCPNITYESIIEQINSLYDFRGSGDNDTTRTLKINTNTMALLSDEDKQIAINKGWMLTE